MGTKSVEVKEVEKPVNTASEEVVTEKAEGSPPAAAEESTDVTPVTTEESSEVTPAATESTEANSAAVENSSEAAAEASSENSEEENAGDQEVAEETPEIKVTMPRPLIHNFCHCLTGSSVHYFHLCVSFLFTLYCGYTVIQLETAPADFRFPTTNQTRHCFTRYIEYHR